jgi:hypothetical protein
MYDRDLFGSMFFWLNWIMRTCPDIGIVSRSLGVMTVTCGMPAVVGADEGGMARFGIGGWTIFGAVRSGGISAVSAICGAPNETSRANTAATLAKTVRNRQSISSPRRPARVSCRNIRSI